MGKPIRVPDPVYQAAEREAEQRDVSLGVVVEGWKNKADKFVNTNCNFNNHD